MPSSSRDLAITIVLASVFFSLSQMFFFGGSSGDLLAVWLGSLEYAQGEFTNIYPPEYALFTMKPPENWLELSRSIGHQDAVYPYIYPPLWVALFAPLTKIMSLQAFTTAASYVNAVLLLGTVWAAARAAKIDMPNWQYFAVALVALSLTTPGLLAMHENQPQIMVTFLLVFALERMRNDAPVAAGAVLALAAAIKIYPVFLVIIWVVGKKWRAVGAFAGFGAVLGVISIALAGWPLHALFLEQLSTISRTVLATGYSYNFNSIIAHFFYFDDMEPVLATGHPLLATVPDLGWGILLKGPFWRLASTAVLIAGLIWIGRQTLRRPSSECPYWVLAIAILAFLSPISWPYYYIPLIVFLPLLPHHFGWGRGLLIAFLCLLPSAMLVPYILQQVTGFNPSPTLLSTLGLVILAATYAKIAANHLPNR